MSSANEAPDKQESILTSKNLAKKIFAADLPEQYIKTIPAQSLYLALKRNGLQSSVDLLEIASIEQCRIMIDFDCWKKDTFDEENFWEWLSLTSEGDDLSLLQKILKCIDLKIITLLIAKYIQFEFFEEATDSPPGPGYYTPDKGSTWLNINTEDSNRHFLLGRVLALLFETDANLFYKLLSLSTTQTAAVLEEEAYQDKSKRLSGEGIPEYEIAAGVNNPANEKQISAALNEGGNKKSPDSRRVFDIRAVEPLIFDSKILNFLNQLLSDISIREDLETELTYIMNSAFIAWSIDFSDYDAMFRLSEKVKGAINIGLEKCHELSGLLPPEVYKKIGLIKIYQTGMAELKNLKLKVAELKKSSRALAASEIQVVFNAVLQPFPEIPLIYKKDYKSDAAGSLIQESAAIEHLSEIRELLLLPF